MSDPHNSADDQSPASPFDQLMQSPNSDENAAFSTAFRGYDRHEVDNAIGELSARLQRAANDIAATDERHRRALDELHAQQSDTVDALRAEHDAALTQVQESHRETTDKLQADLTAATARLTEAEQRITALSSEMVDAPDSEPAAGDDPSTRQQFEAVLRVAEEQASALIQNAVAQSERLLDSAREEVATQRADLQADIARITAEAQHDADQVRLKIDTEYTAHEARIQREAAHAAEKVAQAEREAEAVRTEAEKGAAALRAMVTRETAQLRSDTERDVREMNARVLEFEETLTRRQDDAQQEFLVLHNQAVAHAERITTDANEQVASSLEHAQRISAKADDYERLMRAQAQQIEADARMRAGETLDRAREKAQRIVSTVMDHSTGVLRDAEDRTRQLRWQQQQLTSFMSEVRELIRPEGVRSASAGEAPAAADADPGDADAPISPEPGDDTAQQ